MNGIWSKSRIEDVLYVPKIQKNFFSVGVCASKSFQICFEDKTVSIERDGKVFVPGTVQQNRIYRMFFKVKTAQRRSQHIYDESKNVE